MKIIITIFFIILILFIVLNKIELPKQEPKENNATEQNNNNSEEKDGLIQEAQKTTFEANAYALLKAIENTYMFEALNTTIEEKTYYIENGEFTDDSPKISDFDRLPETGIAHISITGGVTFALYNLKWCATKSADEATITITETSIDLCKMPN